jgi:hypothetical protein
VAAGGGSHERIGAVELEGAQRERPGPVQVAEAVLEETGRGGEEVGLQARLGRGPGAGQPGVDEPRPVSGRGGAEGSPDPTRGDTGDNVLGYDLSGDYNARMRAERATSPRLDLRGHARRVVTGPMGESATVETEPKWGLTSTTAEDQAGARRSPLWIDLQPTAVAAIPVPHPLPHVAAHVVQPVAVRAK